MKRFQCAARACRSGFIPDVSGVKPDLHFGKLSRCALMVNLGEQLFSEPRTVGANEKTQDHTCAAAAPGEKGQITGYRAKKDRHTGYADLFHAPIITPNRFFSPHGLTGPAHILWCGGEQKKEPGGSRHQQSHESRYGTGSRTRNPATCLNSARLSVATA